MRLRGSIKITGAIEKGDFNEVIRILDKGGDVNKKGKHKNTALHTASEKGDLKILVELIKRDADVNLQNKYGWTPLKLACRYGYLPCVMKLIASGAVLQIPDKTGNTALNEACRFGHVQVMKTLLENGIDVNSVNDYGTTPLIHASKNGYREVTQELLQHGANVHLADEEMNTALHYASMNSHSDVVENLIEKKPNVNAVNSIGWTALHYASRYGFEDVVEILLRQNVNINTVNGDGLSAIELATECGNEEILVLLIDKKNIDTNIQADVHDDNVTSDSESRLSSVRDSEVEQVGDPIDMTENFYMVLFENCTDGIQSKITNLLSTVSDANHARLFYTYINMATQMKFIPESDRNRYAEESLTEAADVVAIDSYSFTMLKHLLEKAEDDGCIDHPTFVRLRRIAQKRSTENARISSNLNNIRELGLESIERRLRKIESTFRKVCSASLTELPKDQAVNTAIRAILNALSIALGDDLEGTMKTTYMSIVDFSDISHIEKMVNNSGDSAAGNAVKRGLQLVADSSPDSLFELSRAEIFENYAQSNGERALTINTIIAKRLSALDSEQEMQVEQEVQVENTGKKLRTLSVTSPKTLLNSSAVFFLLLLIILIPLVDRLNRMATKLGQIEHGLAAPTRDVCDEVCLVGRMGRLVDEVEIDLNETSFVEKVRKLEEHLFGIHKEGTLLYRILALERGKRVGLLEHNDSNRVDQLVLRYGLKLSEGATPLGKLVGMEELVFGNSKEGSFLERVQSLESVLVLISTD